LSKFHLQKTENNLFYVDS